MRRHCVANGSTKPESDRNSDLIADGSSYSSTKSESDRDSDLIADGSSYGLPSGDTHQRDRRRLHPMRSRPPILCQQQYRHKK